ncbi:MAG: hypothetical protein ACYSTF_00900 [Planctomycetota bacterium]|jgi:hypothetical protein
MPDELALGVAFHLLEVRQIFFITTGSHFFGVSLYDAESSKSLQNSFVWHPINMPTPSTQMLIKKFSFSPFFWRGDATLDLPYNGAAGYASSPKGHKLQLGFPQLEEQL